MVYQVVVAGLAGVLVVATVVATLTRSVVRAGFCFFLTLLAVAGLFVLLGADFMALAQLIVYVGGILVLILFGVMLTQREDEARPRSPLVQAVPSLAVAAGVLGGILYACRHFVVAPPLPVQSARSTFTGQQTLGIQFLTTHLLHFELASVFLLVALVVAAFISRATHRRPGR